MNFLNESVKYKHLFMILVIYILFHWIHHNHLLIKYHAFTMGCTESKIITHEQCKELSKKMYLEDRE